MRSRRAAMLQALASAAVLGGVSTTLGHAQGMSGTWLQCRDAAISENGGPQRPDTGFDEILLVNLTTGSVSGYSSDDRSLTPYARDGAGGGATLRCRPSASSRPGSVRSRAVPSTRCSRRRCATPPRTPTRWSVATRRHSRT